MRLWHKDILDVLPKEILIAQWREIVAIKRQWEKGTLKHRLVSYVTKHDTLEFSCYTSSLLLEFEKRNINYNKKLSEEIIDFCNNNTKGKVKGTYLLGHDFIYLRECIYNLEEKVRRGIISKEEWDKIYNKYSEMIDLWKGNEVE